MTMTRIVAPLLLSLSLVACSDRQPQGEDAGSHAGAARVEEVGIGNDVAPKLIKGGGTAGGAVRGLLNVYAVDGHTAKPLVNAFVMVGGGATYQGATGKDGLITFRGAGLEGPLSVTVAIKGYTTTTVEGLDAANLTLPLSSRSMGPKVETATCKGTIGAWSSLPTPKKDHINVGTVNFLLDRRLDEPRNSVKQPRGDKNLYAPGAPLNQNEWQVTVPAGAFGVFALVLDLDTKGTATDSDDTYAITHVGVKTGLSVQEGKTLSDVTIPVAPASHTLEMALPGSPPAGTKSMTSSVFLELGNKALASIFQDTDLTGLAAVPELEGDFAGGSFWAVVVADDGVQHVDDDRATESLFIERDITGVTQPVAVSLLPLPSGIGAAGGGKATFTLPAGLTMASLKVMPEKAGDGTWEVLFFDPTAGANGYTLPTLPPSVSGEKPAAGAQYLSVYGLDLKEVDMNNTTFADQLLEMEHLTRTGKVVDWKIAEKAQ